MVSLASMTALLAATANTKSSIEHDEGISLINAAAKMGDWMALSQPGSLAGSWVPASVWQGFIQPNPFDFATISQGLVRWDLHPPVYFWLLHLWTLAFGATPDSSIALNAVLALFAAGLILGLAKWVFGDFLRASAVVAFWALSTSTLGGSLVARQYGLLALISVATVWAALALYSPPRQPRWLAAITVAALVGLGMGTHYQFGLLVAGLLAWFTVTCWRQWGRLMWLYGSALAGGLSLFVINPGFWLSLSVLSRSKSVGQLDHRMETTLDTILGFFASPDVASRIVARLGGSGALAVVLTGTCLMLGGLITWALLASRRPNEATPRFETRAPLSRLTAVILIGVWNLAGITGLYLAGRSPAHAMGDRYLAMAWPFLAFVPMLMFLRFKPYLATALVVVWALIGIPGQLHAILAVPKATTIGQIVAPAKHIVVDSVARGTLPRIVIAANPDTEIFAVSQAALVDSPDAWLNRLEPGDLVLSDGAYANSPERRQQLSHELEQRFTVKKISGPSPFYWWRITGVR